MSMDSEDRPELAYWKTAISRLPSHEMRDAAWEFFVRHLAESPKMADTFSGMILVMQANGMYMLTVPEIVHAQAIEPLCEEMDRFQERLAKNLEHQKRIVVDILDGTQAAEASAQAAERSVKQLEAAIYKGWKEVDTDALAERIKEELEETLFKPFKARCLELETFTLLAQEASRKVEQSIGKFRRIHFGGILLTMILACTLVMGGVFAYSWKKLYERYDRKLQSIRQEQRVEAQKRSRP